MSNVKCRTSKFISQFYNLQIKTRSRNMYKFNPDDRMNQQNSAKVLKLHDIYAYMLIC